MKIYHTVKQEDYDALMIKLEAEGYTWMAGEKPTNQHYYEENKTQTTISVYEEGRELAYADIQHEQKYNPSIPIIKYKAKGEL